MYSSKEEKFLPIQESMIPLVTKCKSCQAEIFWIETPSGKKIPLISEAALCHPASDPNWAEHDKCYWAYVIHWPNCQLREEFKK